jgi:hypothetical protein
LIQAIKFARDINIAYETLLLNNYDYPYQQSEEDCEKGKDIILNDEEFCERLIIDTKIVLVVISNFYESLGVSFTKENRYALKSFRFTPEVIILNKEYKKIAHYT